MKTLVRCCDKTVFEVSGVDYEPQSCGRYDPWCYTDPEKDVQYIEYHEWLQERDKTWKERYMKQLRFS